MAWRENGQRRCVLLLGSAAEESASTQGLAPNEAGRRWNYHASFPRPDGNYHASFAPAWLPFPDQAATQVLAFGASLTPSALPQLHPCAPCILLVLRWPLTPESGNKPRDSKLVTLGLRVLGLLRHSHSFVNGQAVLLCF